MKIYVVNKYRDDGKYDGIYESEKVANNVCKALTFLGYRDCGVVPEELHTSEDISIPDKIYFYGKVIVDEDNNFIEINYCDIYPVYRMETDFFNENPNTVNLYDRSKHYIYGNKRLEKDRFLNFYIWMYTENKELEQLKKEAEEMVEKAVKDPNKQIIS